MSQEEVRKSGQPRYALATKQAAVKRADAGERVAQIAAEIGCRPGRIYHWLEQWRGHGGEFPEQRRRRWRRRRPALPGSTAREAELERLLGQKQAELDFFHEALRRIEQVRGPTVEPGAPSPGTSSGSGRLGRKAR